MWHDHPCSQGNKATKRAVLVEVGWAKFEKGGIDKVGVFKKWEPCAN